MDGLLKIWKQQSTLLQLRTQWGNPFVKYAGGAHVALGQSMFTEPFTLPRGVGQVRIPGERAVMLAGLVVPTLPVQDLYDTGSY